MDLFKQRICEFLPRINGKIRATRTEQKFNISQTEQQLVSIRADVENLEHKRSEYEEMASKSSGSLVFWGLVTSVSQGIVTVSKQMWLAKKWKLLVQYNDRLSNLGENLAKAEEEVSKRA